MGDSKLASFEEFVSSLKYFFVLFRRSFPAGLEAAAHAQWQAFGEGDALVKEDGQNNPLVELRLHPEFGKMICDALTDESGDIPALALPRTPHQVAFWRSRAGTHVPQSLEEQSEASSHFETIREAVAWYAAGLDATSPGAPLRIFILGASARYEYTVGAADAQELAERLAGLVEVAVGNRQAEFILCGRDVPPELHGRTVQAADCRVLTRHHVGYLHALLEDFSSLSGSLLVALHSGIGLEHPELSSSWPPTLQRLSHAVPAWFVVTSFNLVEHELAERTLRAELLTQLVVEVSGVNAAGSLEGPDAVGPFDGTQGKRNYAVLRARIGAKQQPGGEGWDLFD